MELKVCDACARFGTIRRKVKVQSFTSHRVQPEGPQFKVVDTYAAVLRSAREKKGMTQGDFATFLKEKESVLAQWEAGGVKPEIETAQRVGRMLGIKVVEREEIISTPVEVRKQADELTLGDFIKVKKRK